MRASESQRRLVLKVARALRRHLCRPRGWEQVRPKFTEGGEAYGWCPILALHGGEVTLEVWLDRLFVRGKSKHPMLACSFSAEREAGRSLYHGAPSDLRRMVYATPHRDRPAAYGGAPVVERDAVGDRYVTTYLRPGELDSTPAAEAFARFFRQYRWIAEDLPEFVPEGRAGIDSKEQASALTGLLGELKVLGTLSHSARWMGAGRGSYDIESGGYQIEVKSGRGGPDAPTVTLSQIRSGTAKKRLFAFVSITPAASKILDGGREPSVRGPRGIVKDREDEVRDYLRRHGVRCVPGLPARLSTALRHCRIVGWYRLRHPEGWRAALHGMGEFGKIRGTVECEVGTWFHRLRGCPIRRRRR